MFYILCGINSKHIVIFKKKGWIHIKNYHQIIFHMQWWHHKFLLQQESYKNIGCDDDGEEEEVDSDNNMEYTEDAIDNMILEFSRD